MASAWGNSFTNWGNAWGLSSTAVTSRANGPFECVRLEKVVFKDAPICNSPLFVDLELKGSLFRAVGFNND